MSLSVRTEQGATIMPIVWKEPLEMAAAMSPGAVDRVSQRAQGGGRMIGLERRA